MLPVFLVVQAAVGVLMLAQAVAEQRVKVLPVGQMLQMAVLVLVLVVVVPVVRHLMRRKQLIVLRLAAQV